MTWLPIEQLPAALDKLGTPGSEFRYSVKHFLYRVVQCGAGVVLGLFFVYLAYQMTRQGWALPIVLMLIALAILSTCGYVIKRTIAWQDLRVVVFPAGLLRVERDRFIILYWGQIESVWENHTEDRRKSPFLPGRETHIYTVQLADGEKVVFDDSIQAVVSLGEIVEEQTTRRMLPSALKKYNEGGEISFGTWSVSAAGLKREAKTLPWETIGNVEIYNGVLTVKQHGRILFSGLERTSEIPNLSLLLALIDALLGDVTQDE